MKPKLSAEEEQRLVEWCRTARELEVSVERAKPDETETAILKAYQTAGLESPTLIWCGSPLSMYLSRATVALMDAFYDKEESGFGTGDGFPAYFQGFKGTCIGENVRCQIRDMPLTASESTVRNKCSFQLWEKLSSVDSGGGWRTGNLMDSESEVSPIIGVIRQSIATIARFENGRKVTVCDTVWNDARSGAEQILGYSISHNDGDFKTVSNHRWPYFFGAVQESLRDSGYGQHDVRFVAIQEFFKSISDETDHFKKIDHLLTLVQTAGWYLPHRSVCWLSQRPIVCRLDQSGQPHCEHGPAISFPDGWEIFAWHGVPVPEKAIMHSTELTLEEMDTEPNIEVRRVMIERFGEQNYFLAGDPIVIDDDPEVGTLLLRRSAPTEDEPVLMVRVVNSTAEPDGTRKIYYLRVPPDVETAREAVAWTFSVSDYQPTKET